jgi:hypothetical protein
LMQITKALVLALSFSVMTMAGCGEKSQCERLRDKLVACEVITEGKLVCILPKTTLDCEIDCVVEADCTDVGRKYCADETSDSLDSCLQVCLVRHLFMCADGEPIPHKSVCDGRADCEYGADEYDCDYFDCGNGTTKIPSRYVCDNEEHCSDGSDEIYCPSFQCKDGERIPLTSVCDGYGDCPTMIDREVAADEVGCAQWHCARFTDKL